MASVTTDQRLGVNASLAVKVPCAVASTSNLTLSGEQSIDGVTTSASRVLVTGQTDTTENGIYKSDTGAWAREPDWDGASDVIPGTIIRVVQGTSNYGYWAVTTPSSGSITPGTTAVSLSRVDADGVLREDLANASGGLGAELVALSTVSVSDVATFIADTWSSDKVYIVSYYTGWAATAAGPEGGFLITKTGYTNSSPSAGTAVAASRIGAGDGTGSTTGQIAQVGLFWDAAGTEYKYRYEDQINLASFGGIPGSSTANAATNARALTEAITFVAGAANSFLGGVIDLGDDQWAFGAITLDELWGWEIRGHGQKIFQTAAMTIKGCAGFKLENFFTDASTASTYDAFTLDVGTVTGERCHNFIFKDVSPGSFLYGIHIQGDTSQGWIINGQFSGNTKSIYCESGNTVDHIVIDGPIFSNHSSGTTAFDFRGNNWRLVNAHFETNHGNAATTDLYAAGQQFQILGGEMTQSGGIVINCNNGKIDGMIINRCCATIAIDSQAGEVEVSNTKIRWDVNTGAGTAFTDGLGKTAIKGVSFLRCAGNTIKRPGTGIHTTGDGQTLNDNYINDPATYGYHLQNSDNVKVNGGTISLTQAGATGVYQQTGNAPGVSINYVNWIVSAGTKYSFAGSQAQVHEMGSGSPEGVLYGGAGSTWTRQANFVEGRTNYVKTSAATVNTGWRPVGVPVVTTTELADITDIINTEDKFDGGQAFNTTTNKIVFATGSTAGSVWVDATGATAHTPV